MIVHDPAAHEKHGLALMAERAREYAEIHQAVCRWRRQGAVCSTCSELDERAARLACAAGEVA